MDNPIAAHRMIRSFLIQVDRGKILENVRKILPQEQLPAWYEYTSKFPHRTDFEKARMISSREIS